MTLAELAQLRQRLHKIPERSGAEVKTAALIADLLSDHAPDQLLTGLGGHGVAAVYGSGAAGPTVLIRCELDGLPIEELSDLPYRSTHAGHGHLCGHDGHMAMVAGLAPWLAAKPLQRGRAVLLFQPAEETGQGAAAVLADPRFAALQPDYAFALHNLPGAPVGAVQICSGAANCASRGMRIRLLGRTSHAAEPQDGVSPATALSLLLPQLAALGSGGALDSDFALTTVTHCRLGEASFGIAPGEAEIWVTLRSVTDVRMQQLVATAEQLAETVALDQGLQLQIHYDDVFDACENSAAAVACLQRVCDALGYPAQMQQQPQKWSEDFGQFRKIAPEAAMFWLGSGEAQPQLHNPDYDFPDAALPVGQAIFRQLLIDLLG